MTERIYRSALAPYIESLIELKQACGFDYRATAYTLERLDKFLIERNFSESQTITQEMSILWACAIPEESGASKQTRMTALRQLALHMCSLGIEAYIPKRFSNKEKPVHYIPTKQEMIEFFKVVDAQRGGYCDYMTQGYKVAFRLMYCCGLRISECSNLELSEVDEQASTLTIRHSKGNKDRLVYMAHDICSMVCNYRDYVRRNYDIATDWLFPGKDPTKHVPKTTYDRKFSEFWSKTPSGRNSLRKPTPHSLRHAFVVNKMNSWMEDGVNLEQMMPYLATYLGHSSANETFYYYHQVEEAFKLAKRCDKVTSRVIPGVIYYENIK